MEKNIDIVLLHPRMKKPLLECILDKPPMYCGKNFLTIDEFCLFFRGIALGIGPIANRVGSESVFSPEEAAAVARFDVFMRYHLHGCNKNSPWEYDLLAKDGGHREAIESAKALMKFFYKCLCEQGIENLDKILSDAHGKHVYRHPRCHVADFCEPE